MCAAGIRKDEETYPWWRLLLTRRDFTELQPVFDLAACSQPVRHCHGFEGTFPQCFHTITTPHSTPNRPNRPKLMPLESSRNALSWSHERPFNVSNNWLRLKMRTIRAQKWERFHNCPRANKCKSFEGRRNTPVTSLALSQMWLSVSSAVINLKPFGNSIWWHSCARIVETHENYQGAICDWLMQ